MQLRITPPMTPPLGGATIIDMEKARRRTTTPLGFRESLAKRIKDAREAEGFSHAGIADRLTQRIGREISADTYRKWETVDSSIQLDAILAFCDITKIHPYELLSINLPAAAAERPRRRQHMTDLQTDRMLEKRRR